MRQICTIITALIFAVCQAQIFLRGGEIFRIGNSDVYWAAVKTTYFKEYVARQEEDCWCWAACVQMVLNYQGVDVNQEDLVRRAKGYRVNEGGTAYDIQRAADGWRTDGHVIVARAFSTTPTAREEVRDWSDFFPAVNTIVSLWR